MGRRGLLFTLIAGIVSAAHPDAKQSDDAIHPFAKYKSLALGVGVGADGISSAVAVTTTSPTPTPTRPLLECFQVAEPVLTPSGVTRRDITQVPPGVHVTNQKPLGGSSGGGGGGGGSHDHGPSVCAVVLMEHTFENSYGAPFVGKYTPPKCDFDHVVINFTTLVRGRQYDRTGVMYLGDTEVWRTSTAEPTPYGIRWEWLKDMTAFQSLWKKPQTLIFDLENIVNPTYTGLLNTTLTATFFKVSDLERESGTRSGKPADLIIPISQNLAAANKPSQFVYPVQNASSTISAFPRNANRAVFTVDVKAQGSEEFWWSNVPQSAVAAFADTYGAYPGYSAFREVQVLIDGYLAGVSWPFPVIYTGGVVPHLHRPIVGIQAFDILEHEIDISPFLPLLCDGKPHTFAIKIVGLEDDGKSTAKATLSSTTENQWYITGKVFVWLDDDAKSITTGRLGDFYPVAPIISLTQHLTKNASGVTEALKYNLAVSRSLSISSYVKTAKTRGPVTWSQSLSYSNIGRVSNYGNDNINTFAITGSDAATGPRTTFAKSYRYPLFSNSSADETGGSLTLAAQVDQGLQVEIRGDAVFPTGLEAYAATGQLSPSTKGSKTKTWRNSTASYFRPADNSYSSGVGHTRQLFSFAGVNSGGHLKQLYYRDVKADNDTVTWDHVQTSGKDFNV